MEPVAVKVRNYYRPWLQAGRDRRTSSEIALSVPGQNHGAPVLRDGDVEITVLFEVADAQRHRPIVNAHLAGGFYQLITDASRKSFSVREQNQYAVTRLINDCDIGRAVCIKLAGVDRDRSTDKANITAKVLLKRLR